MAKQYKIGTPDGKFITVEGPDDATDDELIAFARSQVGKPYKAAPVDTSGVKRDTRPSAPKNGVSAKDSVGAGVLSFADSASLGLLDEAGAVVDSLGLTPGRKNIWDGSSFTDAWRDNTAKNDAALRAGREDYPIASTLGGLAGLAGPVGAAGALRLSTRAAALARSLGASSRLARSARVGAAIAADAGVSAAYGAGSSNEHRGEGALTGGLAGAAGNVAGRALSVPVSAVMRSQAALAAGNAIRTAIGRATEAAGPQALSRGGKAVLAAAQKAGIAGIRDTLESARSLNVPMALADTHPELRELGAAAVRRSPSASQVAEQSLLPRSRGQIDRFGQAVDRDLGPIGNTLEQSNALREEAKAAAAPLYERAYSVPGRTSDELQSLLQTPFGKKALGKARTIAANERQNPNKMGFDLNDQGDVVLTSVPSMKTIDYAKRGMDDVLEEHRNPITNRLVLSDAGRAQNQVKNELLREADNLVPEYGEARRAYQGPMESLDALQRGQDFYGPRVSTNQVAASVAEQTPEHLAQMQLGYRDSLMNHANGLRYSSNPFDGTLGTPASETKLAAMYPGSDGVSRMLAQRDLEKRLAETKTAVLGNSKTAQRQIADQAFSGDDTLGQIVDAGVNVAMGQIPTGIAIKSLTSQRLKDAWRFGVGKKAVAKADEIAPALFATDPAAASDALTRLIAADRQYRALVAASRAAASRPLAAAGTASGAQFGR